MRRSRNIRNLRSARGAVIAALCLTWGCETGPAGPGKLPAAILATIEVAPRAAEIVLTPPGNTLVLTVVARDDRGGVLEDVGPATFTSGDSAVATVDRLGSVTSVAVGTAEITATLTFGGVTRVGTARIAVVDPPRAVGLAFVTEPGPALAGLYTGFPIRIAARDSEGRTAARFEETVTIALLTNPGGAVLHGTTRVRAVRGVATFADLHIRNPAPGYKLVAAATGLESATSAPFDVNPGGRIAFVSDRTGIPKIYLMHADGTEVERLTSGPEPDSRPAISPDGRRIAFARAGDSGSCGIYLVSVDGSDLRRLTSACGDESPAWAPDGARIAFSRWNRETLGRGIHVMSADGSGVTRLTDGLNDEYPAWSPDGLSIAFNHTVDFGLDWFTQVYVMAADGSGLRKLTPDRPGGPQYAEGGPAWSPDGFAVAFYSFGYGIATVGSRIAGEPTSIYKSGPIGTFHPGDVGFGSNPAWSPDGRKIVFARGDYGERKLYVANASGGGALQPLTAGSSGGEDYEAAWTETGH